MMLQPNGPNRRREDQSPLARAAAGMLKWMPLWHPALLFTIGVAAAVGFKMVWPADQIEDLTARVVSLEETSARTQATLQVLADAKCVELTPQQIALLSQLDCSAVFDRMRLADRQRR